MVQPELSLGRETENPRPPKLIEQGGRSPNCFLGGRTTMRGRRWWPKSKNAARTVFVETNRES